MSRIGKKPVIIPANVTVDIAEGNVVTVKGPKGTLTETFHSEMIINQEGNVITVARPNDTAQFRSLHGLVRTMLSNMVIGVDKGFEKNLEIKGVGYKAKKDGKKLVMDLGFSHQVIMEEIEGIEIDVPAPDKIVVKGINKQVVGQFAANVRAKRPPEPYKGKGVRYANEVVRLKEGKTGGKK